MFSGVHPSEYVASRVPGISLWNFAAEHCPSPGEAEEGEHVLQRICWGRSHGVPCTIDNTVRKYTAHGISTVASVTIDRSHTGRGTF